MQHVNNRHKVEH